MELIVTAQTEVQSLVGGTFTTEHFGPFVLATVDHAPELNAICYGARDAEQGYLFLAFLPYGAALIGE